MFASENADDITGIWQNESGKGRVQIFKQNGKYFGRIVWVRDIKDANGQLKVDKKNPDENLRNRPIVGMQMLRDLSYDNGEWSGGKLYNPQDGNEYKCIMKLKDPQTLKVRGYIGFSWIGKTDIWSRVH